MNRIDARMLADRWDDAAALWLRVGVAEARLARAEMSAELTGVGYLKVTRQADGSLAYQTLNPSLVTVAPQHSPVACRPWSCGGRPDDPCDEARGIAQ